MIETPRKDPVTSNRPGAAKPHAPVALAVFGLAMGSVTVSVMGYNSLSALNSLAKLLT